METGFRGGGLNTCPSGQLWGGPVDSILPGRKVGGTDQDVLMIDL